MSGIASYLTVAAVVAVAAFLLAEWIRRPGARAPDHPARVAVVAGLLWPMVVLGLAQWALVVAVHKRRRAPGPAPRIRAGAEAHTP